MEHLTTKPHLLLDDPPLEFSEAALARIREILKTRRNFDIGSYKVKYMKRRIAIRVRATRVASLEAYSELIGANERELDLLLKGLTIHVSQFFRNRSTFDKLHLEVLPALFARLRREGREEATIWSVGCASGEEPYTLATILRDWYAAELKQFKISLVATDINERILETARRGEYVPERLQEVPVGVRERHFQLREGKYLLSADVRKMVEFRRGDIFDLATYPESDLILCRNVLIYFERGEQERILQGLAGALSTGGVLVLGKAETLVGESRRRFATVCPVERIYTKNRFSAF